MMQTKVDRTLEQLIKEKFGRIERANSSPIVSKFLLRASKKEIGDLSKKDKIALIELLKK